MTIEELQLQIQDLQRQINQFNAASTISHDVEQAIRTRFKLDGLNSLLQTSTKGATSENKAVNEAGAASYSVMDKPDGFLQTTINGVTKYIPFFN